jgi:hypothetical protein
LNDKVQAGLAVVGLAGAVVQATQDYATDLRNVGSTAFGILTYRKAEELIAKKEHAAPKTAAHGEFAGMRYDDGEMGAEEDPVVAAARKL